MIPPLVFQRWRKVMMGRQQVHQGRLFYLFNLEKRIPSNHLLCRINPIVTCILTGLRGKLQAFYSEIGRPSIDPELMLRMLIVAYCYGIRSERKLCEEVELRSLCVRRHDGRRKPPISRSLRCSIVLASNLNARRSSRRPGNLPPTLPDRLVRFRLRRVTRSS